MQQECVPVVVKECTPDGWWVIQWDHCSLANSEGRNISLKNKLFAFLTPYLLSYTPKAFPICKINFHRFSLKNLWVKNEKSMKKSSPILLNFEGLWYAKRPAWSRGHSCWKNYKKKCFVQGVSKKIDLLYLLNFSATGKRISKAFFSPKNWDPYVNFEYRTISVRY